MVKENEFPYNCMDCSAKFKDVQEAKTHFKLAHKEKRLFTCTICEKPFTRADTLKRHFTTVHEEKRLFKCDNCDKDY